MNYDQWKLSNPIDDGYGYDMVSNCCGAEIVESEYSECCGARYVGETDLCSECKEHCGEYKVCSKCGDEAEPVEDYEYEAARKEAYAEMMADGERDER